MKKFYMLIAMTALLLSSVPSQSFAQSTTGKAYVGYAKYDDQIWEYDGLSLSFDSKVGCAILLTRDQLVPYIGGTIKSMRVGWDTSTSKGKYECFVRKSFNGEDLTTGTKEVALGWNTVTLEPYEIPEDVDTLIVGFTTNLKKDVCSIPKLYPTGVKNSCYLWIDGEFDDEGDPAWVDMQENGILPILLVIQDTKGTFNFLPAFTSVIDNGVVIAGQASDCLMKIKNLGSQAIKKVEVTSTQGEQSFSKTVTLSSTIAAGSTSRPIMMPLTGFESGPVELSITKVNGKEVSAPCTITRDLIVIPKDVAAQFTRRPLVEYYESENSYMSSRYYDEYVGPGLRGRDDKLTFVCQHMDDQFMTGDDDATLLALQLCGNDSSLVSVPAMAIDRATSTGNILYQQGGLDIPMFSVLLSPYDAQAYKAAMEMPTFVSVEASGFIVDEENLTFQVKGVVAPGVMPADEHLRLTVYLMEREVWSDSQMFWTDKEKEATKGEYIHSNVIREILSASEGDQLTDSETFKETYETTIDPEWNLDNLYLVAFVHRDGSKGKLAMHVLNSTVGEIGSGVGIQATEQTPQATHNAIFDLSGRRIAPSAMKSGLYLRDGHKVIIK